MAFQTPSASEFGGNVEAGVYHAKFSKYYGPKEGKWGSIIDAEFEIVGNEDYAGQKVTWNFIGVTSKKMYGLIAALNGGEYAEGVDLDDFIGTKVRITVDEVEKGDSVYSNVIAVKAATRRAKPAPKPQVDDFEVDDDDEDLV